MVCRFVLAACTLLLLTFAASSMTPSNALAQAEPEQTEALTERARTLFTEGLTLADSGDWERAVNRFRRALMLRDAIPVRFNLATSLARLGRLTEALVELERVENNPEADDEVRDQCGSLRAELRPQLGRLNVEIQGSLGDRLVTVDGTPWFHIGEEASIDPGIRIVRMLNGPTVLALEEADVGAGALARVRLIAPPLAIEPQPAEEPEQEESRDWVWPVVVAAFFIVAGAGAISTYALIRDEI